MKLQGIPADKKTRTPKLGIRLTALRLNCTHNFGAKMAKKMVESFCGNEAVIVCEYRSICGYILFILIGM